MRDSRWRRLAIISAMFLFHGCAAKEEPATPEKQPGPAASAAFNPADGTAGVAGTAILAGAPPSRSELRMHADPVCVASQKGPVYSEEVLVEGGRLANVFVYVKEGLEKYTFVPPAEPAALTQEGCRYHPHVSGIMTNQTLRIVNNDPTMHNIHCWAALNTRFNIGQPVQGMEAVRTFPRPEVMIRFACDVHKWMTCYVGVVAHPYFAVTGRDGAFSLKGLPPGVYLIEAWHEKYGTKADRVVLHGEEIRSVQFTFGTS